MRYYAHFGHTEFVFCLGYGAKAVKDYFLNYRETESNDFILPRAAGASSCWAPTSADGRSPSSTPAWTRRSVNGCAGYATTSRARNSSSRTTATSSPTRQ